MDAFAQIKNKENNKTLFFKNNIDNIIKDLKHSIWLNNITFETHDISINEIKVDKDYFDKHLFTDEEEIKGIHYERLLETKQEKLKLCLI